MNIKRILTWGGFFIVIGLIIWGMIVAAERDAKKLASIPLPDKISSTDWVTGNASSSIVIVEYSDFQCPACAAYFPMVDKLVAEYSDRLRFVYRHFPLTQHANAIPTAHAAEAAGKQGKFWEMYRMIFSTHDEWENSTEIKTVLDGYAVKLGLDMARFNADFTSKEVADKVQNDLMGGVKAGVDSTPTFYINGKKIKNPNSYEEFKKLIDEAITPTIKP